MHFDTAILNHIKYKKPKKSGTAKFSVLVFSLPIILSILLIKFLNVRYVSGDYNPKWGVLAINTNKTIYKPHETAKIEYAVLDIMGKMDCSAQLQVQIYTDGQLIDTLSTNNGQIRVNPDCQNKEGAKNPDFVSEFTFENLGEYSLELTANTSQGSHSLSKKVQVADEVSFDIERKSTTRIYPRNEYEVALVIIPQENFKGIVEELVPASFEIFPSKLFEIIPYSYDSNKLVWNVNWSKNEQYELTYKYQAPLKSPEFYQLGPLSLNSKSTALTTILGLSTEKFSEFSTWQIASDDLLNRYAVGCTSIGARTWSNVTNAEGTPTLASNATLGSFSTANSSVGLVSDQPDLECNSFDNRDLGTFNSATIYFSYAMEGTNNGDDYIDIDYEIIGGSRYDLTTIVGDSNSGHSNSSNGGYWNYSAANITSWTDVGNTLIHFEGIKVGSPDRNNAYSDAVWIEIDYTPRTYTQNDFEWYVPQGSVTLTNLWPTGNGDDLTENEVFTQFPASNEALSLGAQIRLQMNFTVGAATLPIAIESFVLQYAADEDCTAATVWTDVGAKASGSIWRLYDEAALADSVAQVNQISTSDAGAEGYFSEVNASSNNPNAVTSTQDTEWDWALEHNGAADNTTYCFRMAIYDEITDFTYNSDGYPKLTTAPGTIDTMRHGNIFQNEVEKGLFWAN